MKGWVLNGARSLDTGFLKVPAFYCCDALEGLRQLDSGSIHCAITSPPYWGLRDYGVDGQIGQEPTIDLYVQSLVEVFRELRRALRADGTLWLNLGDSYASSGRAGKQQLSKFGERYRGGGKKHSEASIGRSPTPQGLQQKQLLGVPWRVAFALQEDGWFLRSEIVWVKLNPMPESVEDRPTGTHEKVFLLSKSPRYFYDQDAIRERTRSDNHPRKFRPGQKSGDPSFVKSNAGYLSSIEGVLSTRNARNFWNAYDIFELWEIATQAVSEKHYATFPEELVRRCLLAGTSSKGVCSRCGAPWIREVEVSGETPREKMEELGPSDYANAQPIHEQGLDHAGSHGSNIRERVTTGWSPTCSCLGKVDKEHPKPGMVTPSVVLDPFMGSGTTGKVCERFNRDWIGFDLDERNIEIAKRRITKTQKTLIGVE